MVAFSNMAYNKNRWCHPVIGDEAACGGTWTSPTGIIRSPNFPNDYNNNLDCVYVITAPDVWPEGNHVTLTFTAFDLEVHANCSYDYVEIRDGDSDTSATFRRHCNITLPFTLRSSENQMWIKFVTDGSVNKTGFSAAYTTDCGRTWTSPTGIIQSPNFPNNYSNNLNCVNVISAPEGRRVTLKFTAFNLEANANCSYDYVGIRDGSSENSGLLGIYCDALSPFTVESSGQKMWINFVTDHSINSTGFNATYARVCGETFTAPTGTIQSPNFPNNYDNNLNCVYVITAPEGHRVTLRFTSFSLEAHANCSYDYVRIRDGSSETSGFLGIYCDALSPFTVASSGNQLWITFVTDTSRNSTGFIATYTGDYVQTSTTSAPITISTPSTTSTSATISTSRITFPSMTTATHRPIRTTSTTRLLTTPSTTTPASTTITTTTTEHVVLATSKELPFDTDGSQELTLTCSVDTVSQVREYGWSVTCEPQTGNTCLFLPQLEDDGKMVTCTVTLKDGGSAAGSLKMELDYPPHTTPFINGYTKGEVLKAGNDLRVTCSVHGGKPLVKNVIFSCDGHPDTAPDITSQIEVLSVLQFKPVTMEDDGKRCVCTAEWKNTDWYRLSVTTILTVNATQEEGNEEQKAWRVPVIAGAVGTGVVIIIVIIVVVVVVFRRRNDQRTYDRPGKTGNSTQAQASPYSGLPPVDGQPFVVSNRSFDPIATPDDGAADNNRNSLYDEIGEVSDAPPVPSRRPASTGSTDSYILPVTEPEHDYIECIGP
ncbi:uncharacterized protein [Littorina saxatilis]|uniref:uncharacterized protein n=1 Tax=Littorina saxatilis TaxID=31220 RepID=UPI0038B5469A